MATNTRSTADRLRAEAERLLTRANEVEQLEASEPQGVDGRPAVIQWTETFGRRSSTLDDRKGYDYAAIQVDGVWFVTGRHPQSGITWEQVVKQYWSIRHDQYFVVSGWVPSSLQGTND